MVGLFRVLLPLVFLAVTLPLRGQIAIGDTRAHVIEVLGEPSAQAQLRDREILQYPQGGRIELIDGKVTDVTGTLPTPKVSAPPPAAPAPQAATPASPPTTTTTPPTSTPKAQPGDSSLDKLTEQMEAESNPAATFGQLNQQVQKSLGPTGALPLPSNQPPSRLKFALSLLLHVGLTLAALRLAFKLEEMSALWSGTLAIAGIDLAVYAALEALGPVTHGLASMSFIEGGICALVMVGTIQKFCFNKRLANAVVTAMSVKFVIQLCDMWLFPLLLQTLMGSR